MSLEFDNVSHDYGAERILHEVSLTAAAGEITCLLGPSGSGKSTLLRLAAGLERLQSGSLRLDGELLAQPGREPPPERRPIGLVFQDHVLFPHMTVRGNVAFGLHDRAPGERRTIAAACMASVGLTAFAERYPDTLSGGQQQRVALARALAPTPRAILLDEPFANVDVTLRRAMREDTRLALRSARCTTLLVTHDPEEALELADHIAVLDHGRIVQTGSPSDIWRTPAERTVAEMFGQAQRLAGRLENGVLATAFGTLTSVANLDVEDDIDGVRDVDVIVRPKAVNLVKANEGARVVDIRFLGEHYSILVKRGGETLRASTPDVPHVGIGDFVAATFHPTETFVYNRK